MAVLETKNLADDGCFILQHCKEGVEPHGWGPFPSSSTLRDNTCKPMAVVLILLLLLISSRLLLEVAKHHGRHWMMT